jgi:hypothetical protein
MSPINPLKSPYLWLNCHETHKGLIMPHAAQARAKPSQSVQPQGPRHCFHKPHTSLGATGHWIRTAGILAPLIIGEFIKDPDKKWRAIRIASVATALISEGMWTHKIRDERRERAEEQELACLA